MPELPEVQAHAERLTEAFAGDRLARFQPIKFTALKTAVPPPDEAYGHALEEVGRRGKYLLMEFAPLTFVVHLMQGGRLKEDEKQSLKPRGGQARWRFEDGRALLLTEAGTERRAGVWCVPAGQALASAPLVALGPEAMDVTPQELATRFAAQPMRLHTFLRNQRCIAGIGRRLANEVCHRAKVSPFASTGKLGLEGAQRVVDAIHDSVTEGLAFERSRTDMSASADRPGGVHKRTGEACPVCGDTVREVEYSSYRVHYCPTCQTGGKVLADNTTSRFLK
ncbi:MAG TPA: DNA-formamidopyrimidine glycosylase family protein [Acidimicrobiales bacterium]|nr:DNA-formamidopyrimidine glycosylase family protein [Acidimicrobiales bacterium]